MEEFKTRYPWLDMSEEELFSQNRDPYAENAQPKEIHGCTKHQEACILDVARMMHSSDPFYKLSQSSQYGNDIWSPEFQDIVLAMDVYRQEIIMKKR